MQHKTLNNTNKYFDDLPLLQNTLLPFFYDSEPLKYVNKIFYNLNYDKYNAYPHGIVETYYKDTKMIKERIAYKNGILNGLSEEYYSNGKLYKRKNYKNGIIDGLFEMWYENGKLSLLSSYKNLGYDGLCDKYYENGQLHSRKNYIDNKLNGLYEVWNVNSLPEEKKYYKNNIILWEELYINGKIWRRVNNETGLREEWYQNGNQRSKTNTIYGTAHGLYELWYESGKLCKRKYYKMGKLIPVPTEITA